MWSCVCELSLSRRGKDENVFIFPLAAEVLTAQISYMERYLRTKTTTYSLVSYSRAHDYDAPQAGKTTAQWKDTWIHQTLRVALDEVTTEGNDMPTTLRLRIITGGSGAHFNSSSQVSSDQVHVMRSKVLFQGIG